MVSISKEAYDYWISQPGNPERVEALREGIRQRARDAALAGFWWGFVAATLLAVFIVSEFVL